MRSIALLGAFACKGIQRHHSLLSGRSPSGVLTAGDDPSDVARSRQHELPGNIVSILHLKMIADFFAGKWAALSTAGKPPPPTKRLAAAGFYRFFAFVAGFHAGADQVRTLFGVGRNLQAAVGTALSLP